MDRNVYKDANREKYAVTREREKFATQPSKIVGLESFRRRCRDFARPDERILDIGGGAGIYFGLLEEAALCRTGNAFAVDLSPAILRERGRDLRACGDMENLPYKDQSFDRSFFFYSIHHVRDTHRALSEARRVTRKGGHVVLMEPTSARLLLRGGSIESVDQAEFCFSVRYLLRELEAAGLRVVYRRHRGFAGRILAVVPGGRVAIARIAERIDDLLSRIPFLGRLAVLGDSATIVARRDV